MQILEGTCEEIRAHDSELAGRRVKLIVVDEPAERSAEIDPRWAQFIGSIEAPQPTDAHEIDAEVSRVLATKHVRGTL